MLVDFRCPDVLDPNFVDLNPRRVPASELLLTPDTTLEERFRKACEYGQALWYQLAQTRRYLRDHVAGSDGDDAVSPALLSSTEDWQRWAALYTDVCSVLAGTSGDSGFGHSEATLIARAHGVELNPPTESS